MNIKESADAMTAAVEATGSPVSDFNKGNIKARCRMIAQYALAGSHSGRSLEQTTPRKISQVSLPGFGDGGADILPLYRLNKRQGKQLLQKLGAEPAFMKKSTADLEEDKPGLADAVARVTYAEIDDYLENKTISPEAQATIENWWHKGQHKRPYPSLYLVSF